MRTLVRNERRMWYATFNGKSDIIDENGDIAGQKESYSEPIEFWAVLSPGQGYSGFGGSAYRNYYGVEVDADRRIETSDLSLPIDTTSLIWITEPGVFEDGSADPTTADFSVAARPADGLNFLSIPVTFRAKDGHH